MSMTIIISLAIVLGFYLTIAGRLKTLEEAVSKLQGEGSQQQPEVQPQQPTQTMYQKVEVPQPLKVEVRHESSEETFGKTLGIIGIFAVLFGIGFFLKFAFDNNLIGITGRLLIGVGLGTLVIVLGWLIKAKYQVFSYLLSGGGIGVLFVTSYTAHVLYNVISVPTAFLLFGIITIISVGLSIFDGKMLLACIGVAGGFFAPFLISVGNENFIPLFSYILIINVGVVGIAYIYRWLALHYIAFIGTIFSVMAWLSGLGNDSDRILFFSFVALYFIVFLGLSTFHHLFRKELSTPGDTGFIGLNALWFGVVSYIVLNPIIPDAMGLFVFGVACLYFTLSYISFITLKEDKILNVTLPLIGVIYLTIAIPIQFNGEWLAVMWLIEAFCLCLAAYTINGKKLYIYGIIVYFIGLVRLFYSEAVYRGDFDSFLPVFNGRFVLFAFAILCGFGIAGILYSAARREQKINEDLNILTVFIGIVTQVITLFLITSEIHYFYKTQELLVAGQESMMVSIVWALYAALLTVLGFVLRVRILRYLGLSLFVLTAAKLFVDLWALGPLYRIVTSIVFGVIALICSFLYARFKNHIKNW